MKEIEKVLPNAKQKDRKILVCLYCLYHKIFGKEYYRPRWRELIYKYKNALEECCSCVMASLVIVQGRFHWPIDECEEVFEKYLKRKFKPNAINLPRIIEVAVMAEIANLHLEAGNEERFQHWVGRAILDAAGGESVQSYLRQCEEERSKTSTVTILGIPASAIKSETSEDADLAANSPDGEKCSPQADAEEEPNAEKKATVEASNTTTDIPIEEENKPQSDTESESTDSPDP